MGLGKHQGSHCRDYNTHISRWQLPFQRLTSHQDPVWRGIRWHFLSPQQTLMVYTVTVFTTSRQFIKIKCRNFLSQHPKTGMRFSHIVPDVWLVGIFTEAGTQTKKILKKRFDHISLQRGCHSLTMTAFHSLLKVARMGPLDTLCHVGWVSE